MCLICLKGRLSSHTQFYSNVTKMKQQTVKSCKYVNYHIVGAITQHLIISKIICVVVCLRFLSCSQEIKTVLAKYFISKSLSITCY